MLSKELITLPKAYVNLGTGGGTKTSEFSEKFQRGGGSFSIPKIILHILDLYTGLKKGILGKIAI